ncbi:MAG: amidohydrolase family protein [Saprospiraceae bacterium]
MNRFVLIGLCAWLSISFLTAQKTFPVNGAIDPKEGFYAFTHATIYQRYDKKLEDATLIIRKGRVVSAGQGLIIPKGAVVIDLKGKFIYPGLIEPYGTYGITEVKIDPANRRNQEARKGAYAWNDALKTDFNAYESFVYDGASAEEWRALGFGAIVSHRQDGISRGTSALLSLGDGPEQELILKEKAAHQLSFSKGTSAYPYPSSLMGVIALLRQTYLDGQWYAKTGRKEETNLSLEAWNHALLLPQIFETNNKMDATRAMKIAKEMGAQYIVKTGGDEYQWLESFKNAKSSLIVPVNFPAAYDLSDPVDAEQVSIQDLKHWELAPYNPGRIANAGITFALTSAQLKSKKEFLAQIRLAIEKGLPEEKALQAITWNPAVFVKAEDQLGSLETGKWANFIITSKTLFNAEVVLYQNWIQGKRYILKDLEEVDLNGNYSLKIGDKTMQLVVKGEAGKYKMNVKQDTLSADVKFSIQKQQLVLSFTGFDSTKYNLSGIAERNWTGRGKNQAGQWFDWRADWQSAADTKADTAKAEKKPEINNPGAVWAPFQAYGFEKRPVQETVLFKNATIWTNEAEGVLTNADLLIEAGKIKAVGKNLQAGNARVVDASNKYLTCGIIDEHSHIAISRGVNEGTQVSAAEVRIGDVIDSEDINIYRQLAGGVVASQLLHGSSNPIGGQSAIIKLRWGLEPEQMKIEGAPGFIKFALGENVKQSFYNVGGGRFPQTRMGVEQVYEDYFQQAEAYKKIALSGAVYRRDLDIETIAEILDKKRFITCHSYVQSEINMLMKVAERHNFRINTFTHILEGYKVADKLKNHGAGASTFADWWAYKMEVYEAIPYNAAILQKQGVVTCINSDDAEMARRLNQEAAKTMKYGGVTEAEAWKMVTLNPAKLLHLDQKMGSIKVGKDADIVMWNANPLSVYASADQTWVDGVLLFERSSEEKLHEELNKERARLVTLSQKDKGDAGAKQRPGRKQQLLYHCDTILEEY